jgi:hypothetical protein
VAFLSRLRALVLALTAITVVAFPVPGRAIDRLELHTFNGSNFKAWVTVQDAGKLRNLDSGWVQPMSRRVWWSGHYLTGSYYFVRFEFVDTGGKVLCDTKARIFADYTTSGHTDTATGHYKNGRCWIVGSDKVFPY